MTSINGDYTQQTNSSDGLASIQNQIANLQRQCADWQGCMTTPANEKEKIVSSLSEKIQTLQHKIEQVQQVQPVAESSNIKNETAPADGVNRPSTDPFAISGSVLNTSI